MRFRSGVPKRDPVRQNTDHRGQSRQATLLRGADDKLRQAGYRTAQRLLSAHRHNHSLRYFCRANDRQGNGLACALRAVACEGQNQNAERTALRNNFSALVDYEVAKWITSTNI